MECSYKRKLDCIVDSMEVIGDHLPLFRNDIWENENKKRKLLQEINIDSEHFQSLKNQNFAEREVSVWSGEWNGENNGPCLFSNGGISVDNDPREDDMHEEDVPSTAEVINSLRKVILWMSAQADYKSNHLQYLEEVEQYAISKQIDIAQQRKITQYFFKD